MRELKKELWPCKVVVNSDNKRDVDPIENWLSDKYGCFKNRWNVVYRLNETHFYFRNQKDANWFSLNCL